jgi:hypothetical protein
MAVYGNDGRLQRYRSQHYATQGTLKRALPGILDALPSVTTLVIEGGGALLGVWEREAARRALDVIRVSADEWRPALLIPREHRSASVAKRTAGQLARRIIAWSDAPRPTSLRHDAAEAILIGLWGAMRMGWIDERDVRQAMGES